MEGKSKLGWGIKTGTVYMALSNGFTTVLVIGFQMLAVRLLKPEQYGLVSILYSAVVLTTSCLGQPFELALSKYVSEYEAGGANCFSLIKKIFFWQAIASLCFGALVLAMRSIMIKTLFFDSPVFFYIFAASGVCWGFEFSMRGVLRGLREFGLYGALSITINLFRIIFLLLLVRVMDKGVVGAGLSILFASIANILAAFFWYPRVHSRLKGERIHPTLTLRHLLELIAPIIVLYGAASYLFSIGPVFIKLFAGQSANEVAGLFMIVTMMTRLPLYLFDALFANLLPNMSHSNAKGNWQTLQHYVTRSIQLVIPCMAISIIGVYLLGPLALRLFYPEFSYSQYGMTRLMIGTAIIVLANVYGLVLYTRSKMFSALAAWLAGCVGFTAVVLIAPWNILLRLEVGYLLGSSIILGGQLILAYRAMDEMRGIVQANQCGLPINQ